MTAFDYKSEVDNSLSVKTLSKGFFREKTPKKISINVHCYVRIWGSVCITENRGRFKIFLRPVIIDIYEQLSEYKLVQEKNNASL